MNPRFSGTPFARTWLADDYGGVAGAGAMVQHPRTGFMYIANGTRILEFDGTRWRLLPGLGGNPITCLTIDARGRIWLATSQAIGYLEADELGEWRAVSTAPRLRRGDPTLTGWGAALSTADAVYFSNRRSIVRFGLGDQPPQIWSWTEPELVVRLWSQDNAVHVRAASGVLRLADGEFRPVANYRTASFAARASSAGGWTLLGNDGVRRWDDGYRAVAPGLPAVVAPFENDIALCATFLTDGRIAFGTSRSGIVVCDDSGRRQQVIDRPRGLLANRVEALCSDRDGGLWVALRNGIMRLQLDSPLARQGTAQNRIEGSPTAMALHDGELFVGGGEGLWRRDRAGEFHAIEDVPFIVRTLVPYAGQLYSTGLELRRIERGDHAQPLGTSYFGLVPLSNLPGHFVHGQADGLAFDRTEGGTWTNLGSVEAIGGMTAALCEAPAGAVWAAGQGCLWRLDLTRGLARRAARRRYTVADGLPPGISPNNAELYPWGDSLGGSVAGRLIRFDPATDRFLAETRIAGLVAGPDGFVLAVSGGAGPQPDGSLWLQLGGSAGNLAHVVPAGPNAWRAQLLSVPVISRLRASALLPDAAGQTLWVGGPGALISYDLAWQPAQPRAALSAAIRRVETPDGQLLWADAGRAAGPGTAAKLALPHEHNALRMLFAAPGYQADHLGRTHTQFRTRLRGLDTDWSTWRSLALREFTNLPYREFVLEVQARDDEGRISQVGRLAIAITPPWWLTRWSFAGYAVLGLAAVGGVVQWRTRALRRRAERLEGIVATRTEALRRSNAELERLHAIERDEKLAARLAEEKARLEVLRYQLNPHFLFNALNSVCAQIMREPAAARAMVVRIAEFCRRTLHRPEQAQDAVTIGREIEMLRAYLAIEHVRLGDLMTITVEVDPATNETEIPPFLLLPLVENAVKYGTATSAERVAIRLSVQRDATADGALVIEVANTGQWLTPGAHSAPSTGIGLENLRQRLARYYPGAHEFTTRAADGWVIVRVRLTAAMRATLPVSA